MRPIDALVARVEQATAGGAFNWLRRTAAGPFDQINRLLRPRNHEQLGISRRPRDLQPVPPRTIPPARAARCDIYARYLGIRNNERSSSPLLGGRPWGECQALGGHKQEAFVNPALPDMVSNQPVTHLLAREQ